jgi:hypothetical protein
LSQAEKAIAKRLHDATNVSGELGGVSNEEARFDPD